MNMGMLSSVSTCSCRAGQRKSSYSTSTTVVESSENVCCRQRRSSQRQTGDSVKAFSTLQIQFTPYDE